MTLKAVLIFFNLLKPLKLNKARSNLLNIQFFNKKVLEVEQKPPKKILEVNESPIIQPPRGLPPLIKCARRVCPFSRTISKVLFKALLTLTNLHEKAGQMLSNILPILHDNFQKTQCSSACPKSSCKKEPKVETNLHQGPSQIADIATAVSLCSKNDQIINESIAVEAPSPPAQVSVELRRELLLKHSV